MAPIFDHEKLDVYQDSLKFIAWVTDLLERIPKSMSVHDQLDRASTSIPLNIAEGNGEFTAPDRCRFFDTARGSALECAACLDVLVVKKVVSTNDIMAGKEVLRGVVSMLVGLIRVTDPQRVFEDSPSYGDGRLGSG